MKGIILLATTVPYYTHMAYNLAVSIRNKSDIEITLFHEGAGLDYLFEDQKKIFNLIPLPLCYITENGKREPYKAKTCIYDLSPYDETLYLDVDMIFSPYKSADQIFQELKGTPLQFAVHGEKTMDENLKSEWVDLSEVKEKYGFNHWYDLSSEFIYFEKCDATKKIFDDAKEFYSTHGLKLKEFKEEGREPQVMFKSGTPDELPFSLSLEKNNYKIKAPYYPSYWQPRYFNKIKKEEEIWNNFYLLSVGGAVSINYIKRIYDNRAKTSFQKMGIDRVPYQLVNKRQIMPERKLI